MGLIRLGKIAAVLIYIGSSTLGCTPQNYHARLEPIRYAPAEAKIEASVELCLAESTRSYLWEGSDSSFRIELAGQLDRNAERLARAAFTDVVVTRDGRCGLAGAPLRLEFRIVSAERALPNREYYDTQTTVVLEAKLSLTEGPVIWEETHKGSQTERVNRNFGVVEVTRNDFGLALGRALVKQYSAIMSSAVIRESTL